MSRRRKRRSFFRKKYVLLYVTAFIVIGLIGSTYAFYTSHNRLDNLLITNKSEVFLSEYFRPDDLWLAGETKTKEVSFGNQSEVDQVIRFKVVEKWYNNNGTPNDYTDDTDWEYKGNYTPPPVTVNFTNEINSNWTRIDDYYYYNKVLSAQKGSKPTETPVVIDSVTFSPALSNNPNFGEDFSDKACRISIQMEALNVNKVMTEEAWHVVFDIHNSVITWTK